MPSSGAAAGGAAGASTSAAAGTSSAGPPTTRTRAAGAAISERAARLEARHARMAAAPPAAGAAAPAAEPQGAGPSNGGGGQRGGKRPRRSAPSYANEPTPWYRRVEGVRALSALLSAPAASGAAAGSRAEPRPLMPKPMRDAADWVRESAQPGVLTAGPADGAGPSNAPPAGSPSWMYLRGIMRPAAASGAPSGCCWADALYGVMGAFSPGLKHEWEGKLTHADARGNHFFGCTPVEGGGAERRSHRQCLLYSPSRVRRHAGIMFEDHSGGYLQLVLLARKTKDEEGAWRRQERLLIRAHQLVNALVNGPPTHQGHITIHTCNHPRCLNPRHLKWADHRANAPKRDLVAAHEGHKRRSVVPDMHVRQRRKLVGSTYKRTHRHSRECGG